MAEKRWCQNVALPLFPDLSADQCGPTHPNAFPPCTCRVSQKNGPVNGAAATPVLIVESTPNFAMSNSDSFLPKISSFIIIVSFLPILSAEKPAFKVSLVELPAQGTRSSSNQCTVALAIPSSIELTIARYESIYARHVAEW